VRVYYFGCIDSVGHYMHGPGGKYSDGAFSFTKDNPWQTMVDGGLAPQKDVTQVEGRARIHRKNGWTAMSFWDRSVDTRRNSCSTFIAEGDLGFDGMMDVANIYFPEVVKRYAFKIMEVEE
jgi:hypothetical protein